MHAIFISYRKDDSRGWAVYSRDFLARAFGPDEVFLDNEDLRVGKYQQQLDAALAQCKAFVLIIGPRWLQAADAEGQLRLLVPSDVHRGEIEKALNREGVTLIPLLVDGARMPAKRELPTSIARLACFQAQDLPFGEWRGASSRKRLLQEISRATGLPEPKGEDRKVWSVAKNVIAVLVATLLSSIITVVTYQVVFGVPLTQPDVSMLTLGLLALWSAVAWERGRRVQRPQEEGRA